MSYKYNISIGAYFKNETRFLCEWVEFHLLIGVEHLYLYCNDIDPTETKKVLKSYIKKGIVSFIHYPHKLTNKHDATTIYNKIFSVANKETKWLAFIDLDEFICLIKHKNINQFLKLYDDKEIAAISMLWTVFINYEQYQTTQQLQIEAYTHALIKYKSRPVYKSIIKTSRCNGMRSAHNPNLNNTKFRFVDENKYTVKIRYNAPNDMIRLNHYHLKSRNDFTIKLTNVGYWNNKISHSWKNYEKALNKPVIKNFVIQRFLPELKRKMGITDA